MFSVQPKQTHSMHTRDGVRLDADIYSPVGKGPFPVLLMRQPYGRAIASTIVYAHPHWYAAHGYIVVIQDVRGRGTSAGEFHLFAHEVEDGEDTLHWAAQLPHSDGQVGMYGFSYQGMTQLYAAQAQAQSNVRSGGDQPQLLKTIVPAMTGYRLYEDWAYENGALCLQLGLTWAIQLAAETARRKGAIALYQKLVSAAHHLPLRDQVPACPAVLEGTASFFYDWVAHPIVDSYWKDITPDLAGVNLPTLHIGGWFDPYLRGDVRLYKELSASNQQRHHLQIGPWGHIPWSRRVGEMDFGPAAMSSIDSLQIRWFDHILKGKALTGESKPVRLFEMGRNQWQCLSSWPKNRAEGRPEASVKAYWLDSTGLANVREDSGTLSETAIRTSHYDVIVHDPWNPAPALGGHSALPAGVFERTAVDARGDVLTYTSAPLTEELRVAGVIEMVGAIAASTPSCDLGAVLSRVMHTATGTKIYNLTQGYRRIDGLAASDDFTKTSRITLALHPTCFSLQAGESLRLSLSAACFPAYPVNPGTGAQPDSARLIDAQIITMAIAIGGPTGAELFLPLAHTDR